jgi:hypothetical protein
MHLPAFTAEASLYPAEGTYRSGGLYGSDGPAVRPQLENCPGLCALGFLLCVSLCGASQDCHCLSDYQQCLSNCDPCPPGLTEECGGCTNLSFDPRNCGSCGHQCARNTTCDEGRCVCVGETSFGVQYHCVDYDFDGNCLKCTTLASM